MLNCRRPATVTADVGPSLPFQAGWDIGVRCRILDREHDPAGRHFATSRGLPGHGGVAFGRRGRGRRVGLVREGGLARATARPGLRPAGGSGGASGSDRGLLRPGAGGGGRPVERAATDLRAVAGLAGRFADWRFTLAVEPILLTQLRDMADGYVRLDSSGAVEQVGADDPRAMNAAQVLAAFADYGGHRDRGDGRRSLRGRRPRRVGCRGMAGRLRADPTGQAGVAADAGSRIVAGRAPTRPTWT